MKKMKLIMPILGIPALTCATIPLVGCNNNGDQSKKAASLTGITVKTNPITNEFKAGQTFNSVGLVITAKYSDNTSKDVGAGSTGLTTDFDDKLFTKQDVGLDKDVTVSYKENNVSKTATYKINVGQADFANAEWSDIISAINTFEDSDQDETAMQALCANFGDTPYISDISEEITDPNRQIEAHLANFIGKEHTISINNVDHVVRVVGINHDYINPVTCAAFTFEMVTLLSDSSGNAITSIWDQTSYLDYGNRVIRKNLTGEGEATGEGVWENSVLSMLPSEIESNIKTVSKTTTTYNTQLSDWTRCYYLDKLFPLTHIEMAITTCDYGKDWEGFEYSYWTNHNQTNYKIKKDANGQAHKYWLCTPQAYSEHSPIRVYCVNESGYTVEFGDGPQLITTNSIGISFGFCI